MDDKHLRYIVIFNVIAIIFFTILFIQKRNFEFIGYVLVIITVMILLLKTNKIYNYPKYLLYCLTAWSLLHMAGGALYVKGIKLYELMLIQLIGQPYNILKYDQLVHAYGFFVATLLMYSLIKPSLGKSIRWPTTIFVIIMAGSGAGALNEVLEFLTTLIVANNGVGGYENTALDLCSNLLGAIGAAFIIVKDERGAQKSSKHKQ